MTGGREGMQREGEAGKSNGENQRFVQPERKEFITMRFTVISSTVFFLAQIVKLFWKSCFKMSLGS